MKRQSALLSDPWPEDPNSPDGLKKKSTINVRKRQGIKNVMKQSARSISVSEIKKDGSETEAQSLSGLNQRVAFGDIVFEEQYLQESSSWDEDSLQTSDASVTDRQRQARRKAMLENEVKSVTSTEIANQV